MSIYGTSPLSASPRLGMIAIPNQTPATVTLTTAGGVGTLTAAQLLTGFVIVDCQDAQSLTFPSAALLCAAIPGVSGTAQFTGGVGFDVDIYNSGDTTLTMVIGAGGTLVGTATLLTVTAKRFKFVITDATVGSENYTAYSMGPTTV